MKNSKCLGTQRVNGNICTTTHAEEHVCKYIPYNYKNVKKEIYDIVVFRYNKSTLELANSRPCSRCIKLLKKNKIKNVYYSTDSKEILKEKVKDMDEESAHVSSGVKKYFAKRDKLWK
jgi:deoxycytidylate deaminase